MIGIPAAITVGLELLKQVLPDKASREAATLKLMELEQAGELKDLDAKMQVLVAEAKSEHVITATWRPITMLVFVFIVANNYIIYPYLSLFWTEAPTLEMPEQLWTLIQIGLGGYVFSRGAEKTATAWKGK